MSIAAGSALTLRAAPSPLSCNVAALPFIDPEATIEEPDCTETSCLATSVTSENSSRVARPSKLIFGLRTSTYVPLASDSPRRPPMRRLPASQPLSVVRSSTAAAWAGAEAPAPRRWISDKLLRSMSAARPRPAPRAETEPARDKPLAPSTPRRAASAGSCCACTNPRRLAAAERKEFALYRS